MPIYVYETIPSDGSEPTRFEMLRRLTDPPLTKHPETGEPVRKIITAPALTLKHSSERERNVLSDANISRHGFSKYEKVGDGVYERTAGKEGPRQIRR